MTAFTEIETKLGEVLGLRPRKGSGAQLRRELQCVQRELGLDMQQVAERLERDADLVGRLAHALTVEETFFLRHPEHFERLVSHLRAPLSQGDGPQALVWSAGCASGEEPYSIAIAIHRALGEDALARLCIVANDIDHVSLSKARSATYSPWSFRGAEPNLRERYFEPVGKDAFRLDATLREAVQFEHCSLVQILRRTRDNSVDAIFFRNVAIYLNEAALETLYEGFARVLKPEGLLVLGPADPIRGEGALARKRIERGFVPRRRLSLPAPRGEVASPWPAAVPVSSLRPPPLPALPGLAALTAHATRGAAHEATPPARRPGFDAGPAPLQEMRPPPIPVDDSDANRAAAQARELANQGRFQEATQLLDRTLVEAGPTAHLLGLRGCIQLAADATQRGVEDLRSALFLSPTDTWLRFQYALGLHALQRDRAAEAQLRDILSNLALARETDILSDGETSVAVLRRAVIEFLGRIA